MITTSAIYCMLIGGGALLFKHNVKTEKARQISIA